MENNILNISTDLHQWFSSFKNSEWIALATPFIVALLGAIGWFTRYIFDKKGEGKKTIHYKKSSFFQWISGFINNVTNKINYEK